MLMRLPTRAVLIAASGLLIAMATGLPASAQEFLPNPALSQARSASTTNGGIDSEWEYHRRANSSNFRTTFTPISKFAAGSGYCTPACVAPYYGCDTHGCCRRSSRCGCN